SAGLRPIEAPHDACSVRAPDGTYYGASWQAVERFCRSADLFLNISGSCWLRDEYRGAKRTAYRDSDPGYTQAKLLAKERGYASRDDLCSVALVRPHDLCFTSAGHVAQAECRVPYCGLRRSTTRPPARARMARGERAGAVGDDAVLPDVSRRVPGRVERRQEHLRRAALRLVQLPQRHVSRPRQARGRTGHRMEQPLSNRNGLARL